MGAVIHLDSTLSKLRIYVYWRTASCTLHLSVIVKEVLGDELIVLAALLG